jgi:hypothetical protein
MPPAIATRAAGAERGAQRELLLASFGAHEKQVRHVRAGNEQHEAHGAEQDPQRGTDVTDEVPGERPDIRAQTQVVEHLPREAGRQRKALGEQRQHAADVGVGLLQCHAWFEPADAAEAEITDEHAGAFRT